jgi:hypothetical protein
MSAENLRNIPPTKFIIEPSTQSLYNVADGVSFNTRKISLARRTNTGVVINKISDVSMTFGLEICVREDGEIKPLEIPQKLTQRLAEYLRTRPDRGQEFECGSFVHYLMGIPFTLNGFDENKWEITPYMSEEEMLPGFTILVYNPPEDNRELKHIAMYLGRGLYLSKFGGAPVLLVTTLEEMKKGYKAAKVLVLVPKPFQ